MNQAVRLSSLTPDLCLVFDTEQNKQVSNRGDDIATSTHASTAATSTHASTAASTTHCEF